MSGPFSYAQPFKPWPNPFGHIAKPETVEDVQWAIRVGFRTLFSDKPRRWHLYMTGDLAPIFTVDEDPTWGNGDGWIAVMDRLKVHYAVVRLTS